ncbi:DUF1523 family protein [Cereibacter sp. SYSU M97828]|nr:DUF1523 family protein [Cereibacter flavus]
MRYVKWGILTVLGLLVAGFLNYTLPQRDVVRITNTYNRLTTIGSNWMFYASSDSGTNAQGGQNRDIFFIEAVRPNGKPIVYRNEDTGWVWPPYFKYDSSNLQAQAADRKSTQGQPEWVAITHYGWRMAWLSVYPNALSVRTVEGPDVKLFPWPAIITVGALLALILTVWRLVVMAGRRFADDVGDRTDGIRSRFWRWFRN